MAPCIWGKTRPPGVCFGMGQRVDRKEPALQMSTGVMLVNCSPTHALWELAVGPMGTGLPRDMVTWEPTRGVSL